MRLFQNIRNFIIHNTFVFSVFIVLLILSVCSVLYTVNFMNNIIINNNSASEDGRTYILSVNDASLDEKLCRLVSENDDLTHIYCIIDNNGEAVLADYYGHYYGRDGVSYGKWFSESDFTDGAAKVILPNYPYLFGTSDVEYKRLNIGDSYYIGGILYEAVGIGLLSEFIYQIPYNSIKDKSTVINIGIVTENIGDEAEIREFSEYLEALFGGEVVECPDAQEAQSAGGKFSLETVLIVGIMSMSVFNLAYIYLYILDTRKKELAINRITGQTLFSCVVTAYAEVFIVSSVGYLLSALLMKFCLFPLFKGYGFMFDDSMDIKQYLIVFIIFTSVYGIVFLPAIIHHIKKSPAEAFTDE